MAECGHCRNCKWWKLADEAFLTEGENAEEWRQCMRTEEREPQYVGTPYIGDLLFRTECEDPYNDSALLTKAGFGCVSFEPKEPKDG